MILTKLKYTRIPHWLRQKQYSSCENTRENSLEFVTKYNNQRKVNEIMACLYQGQKTRTDHFSPEAPIVLFKPNN